jgi:hypothetical protein
MAFSISLPNTASAWAELPREVVREFRASLPERPVSRPELTPEQRALRIAVERLTLERGNSALGASHWPR